MAQAGVSEQGPEWLLRRNCSITPGQLGGVFVALAVLSLLVAVFFWFMGATLVLAFTAIELMALATAFLVYARHATDRECIRITGGQLVVEQELAGQTRRCEFARHAVRIEPRRDGDRLVELRGGGQVVKIGRFLRSELRPALAAEIRRALHSG
ncbi:hypothetical protein LPB72_05435 [Hydrogenophaga crassostreae]|uniref:DUF2244 domain-containing protein n=2 Tax=Hydrogenophaga crassostreae TaxID=1763535 RepID=A0A167IPD4_9BURK|nr:hypothetical protein LPB072_19115 [Hydrogenophaga crassostreae]OAD43283.1 hypothetical protein LPB72_05435 [Hydrogenophaga crassostreae]